MQIKYSYNIEQKKVISYALDPLLVLAGAGTGKTSTIIARIAYLVKNKNTLPESILALTFTNDAASHMREKLKNEIGHEADRVEVCTFHAFSKNILIKKYLALGYSKQPELMNIGDINFIIQRNFDDFGDLNSETFKRDPIIAIQAFKAIFESFRHNLFSDTELHEYKVKELENIKNNNDPKEIEKSYQLIDSIDAFFKYQIWKKHENYIDYGDMIINLWKLLIEDKEFASEIQNQYKHVIVDEFQDNNYALSQIIKKIAEPENSIMVVGDDDQCIYSFRQANIQNIKEFKKYYDCKDIITLKKNYRSTSEILDLANFVINKNTQRTREEGLAGANRGELPMLYLGNESEQIYQIIKCIKKKLSDGVMPNEIAILLRGHNKCKILHQALLNEGIRTNYYYEKLFDQIVIKDFIALINICLASKREYESTIRMVKRLIGEDGLIAIMSLFKKSQIEADFLNFFYKKHTNANPALQLLYNIKKIQLNDIISLSIEIIKVGRLYVSEPDSYKTLVKNQVLDQLILVIEKYCKSYGRTDLNAFLTYLNIQFDMNDELVPPLDAINDIPSINLMTIHASKGMEFKHVMIPFLQSSVFPLRFLNEKVVSMVPRSWRRWLDSDRSDKEMYIEEERRLFYVSITRAMDSLVLFAPEKYQSMFIKEISKDLVIEEKINYLEIEKKDLEKKILRNKIDFENELCLGNEKSALRISMENEKLEKNLTINKDDKNINSHNSKHGDFFENLTLSASSINSFLNCPLQYKYKYINKIVDPKLQSYNQLGSMIHFILEKFNKSKNKDKKILFDLLDKYWENCSFEYIQEKNQCKIDAEKMLENYWLFFKSYDIKNNISEYAFTFSTELVDVVGRCDSIFIDSLDNIILIDYKTSKTRKNEKKLKSDMQVQIYSLFMYLEGLIVSGQTIKKIPDKIIIVYLRDTLEEVSISFNDNELKQTISTIDNIYKDICDNDFLPRLGRHCDYCAYKDLICSEFN